MALTFPLAFPDELKVAAVSFRAVVTEASAKSIFDGSEQIFKYSGEWWEADITRPPARAANGYDWAGWMAALSSGIGTFLLGDPGRIAPFGTAKDTPGTPLVNAAFSAGHTLAIDGCPANVVNYLLRGDYIGMGSGAASRMHMVAENASTNGAGQATLNIWPMLRYSPADNTPLVLVNAKTVMRFTSNQRQWSVRPGQILDMTFSAREYLP